jgi:hypothetical protein
MRLRSPVSRFGRLTSISEIGSSRLASSITRSVRSSRSVARRPLRAPV